MRAASNLPVLTCQGFLNHYQADRGLHLYSDFDGTLVALQSDPMACQLTPRQTATIRALAALPGVQITIVSGRSLVDLRNRIGIAGLGYVGNHGLEIATQSHNFVHPGALALTRNLAQWQRTLQDKLQNLPGAWIENKGLSLSIHYRNIPEDYRQEFRSALEECTHIIREDRQLLIGDAKQVVEIRPNLPWTKGSAIQVINDSIETDKSKVRRVYFGDDISDEDAFAQWQNDLTVLVGEADRPTHANHRLADHLGTHRLLEALLARINPCRIDDTEQAFSLPSQKI